MNSMVKWRCLGLHLGWAQYSAFKILWNQEQKWGMLRTFKNVGIVKNEANGVIPYHQVGDQNKRQSEELNLANTLHNLQSQKCTKLYWCIYNWIKPSEWDVGMLCLCVECHLASCLGLSCKTGPCNRALLAFGNCSFLTNHGSNPVWLCHLERVFLGSISAFHMGRALRRVFLYTFSKSVII